MAFQPGVQAYTSGFGASPLNVQTPHLDVRNPSTSDINYPIGKRWVNTIANSTYALTSFSNVSGQTTANWVAEGGPSVAVQTLTGNTGPAVVPTAGNINVLGTNTITTSGSGSTLTITATAGGFPVTPFVVGPAGKAGYQTIQSAINAATPNATVYIQDGVYTENLSIPGGISLVGNSLNVIVVGNHGISGTGTINVRNINFTVNSGSLFGVSSSSVNLFLNGCLWEIVNGYVVTAFSWTGGFYINNCFDVGSTTNGILNITGGSPPAAVNITNSVIGAGPATGAMTSEGSVTIINSIIACSIVAVSGSLYMQGCSTPATLTVQTTAAAIVSGCNFLNTNGLSAIVYTSSVPFLIEHTTIDCPNNPAISGSTSATLTLDTVSFPSNTAISGTITSIVLVTPKGCVAGPASSVNNTVPTFNGTGGNTLKDTGVVIDANNNFTAIGGVGGNVTGQITTDAVGLNLTTTAANSQIQLISTGSGSVSIPGASGLLVASMSNLSGGWTVPAGGTLNVGTGLSGDPVSLGTIFLSSGSVTVNTANVTNNSKIFLTYIGTLANSGSLSYHNIIAGTSFQITSTNASDDNAVNWIIFN